MSTEQTVANIDAAYRDHGDRPNLVRDPLAIREPLTAVTPSLDPRVIDHLEGNDDSTAGYVSCVREAIAEGQAAIQHVIDARIAVNTHSDLSTEQKLLKIAAVAEKKQERAARAMDSAMVRLNTGIKSIEETLTAPLQSRSGIGTVNQELRAKFESMPSDKREQAINDALKHRDTTTLLALAGASHLLSGLTRERHAILMRQYHELTAPDLAKRLRLMLLARDKLETAGPLLLPQIESALGWRWQKVVQARERAKAVAAVLER